MVFISHWCIFMNKESVMMFLMLYWYTHDIRVCIILFISTKFFLAKYMDEWICVNKGLLKSLRYHLLKCKYKLIKESKNMRLQYSTKLLLGSTLQAPSLSIIHCIDRLKKVETSDSSSDHQVYIHLQLILPLIHIMFIHNHCFQTYLGI